jgi:hypothetical protein
MAYAGKVIQILAFGMWYFLTGPFQAPSLPLLAAGVAMLAVGQFDVIALRPRVFLLHYLIGYSQVKR